MFRYPPALQEYVAHVDLEISVAVEKMLAAIEQHPPDLIGFSACLTTTMPMFKIKIEALHKAGWRHRLKIMVGGAPVTQAYAGQVNADGYAAHASSAVRLARRLMGLGGAEASGALAGAVPAREDVLGKTGPDPDEASEPEAQ